MCDVCLTVLKSIKQVWGTWHTVGLLKVLPLRYWGTVWLPPYSVTPTSFEPPTIVLPRNGYHWASSTFWTFSGICMALACPKKSFALAFWPLGVIPTPHPSPMFTDGITWTYPVSEKLLFAAVTTASCCHQIGLIVLLLLLNFVETVFSASPAVPVPSRRCTTIPSLLQAPSSLSSSWAPRHCRSVTTLQFHNQPHKIRLLGLPWTFFGDFLIYSSKLILFGLNSTAPQVAPRAVLLNFPNAENL